MWQEYSLHGADKHVQTIKIGLRYQKIALYLTTKAYQIQQVIKKGMCTINKSRYCCTISEGKKIQSRTRRTVMMLFGRVYIQGILPKGPYLP